MYRSGRRMTSFQFGLHSMRGEKIQNGTLWRERYLTMVAMAMREQRSFEFVLIANESCLLLPRSSNDSMATNTYRSDVRNA
jgi:hypothetical protein